eukprot:scaffold7679_cov258-Pinguiococcus_pyrenoidosus.AAC.1
MDPPPGPGDPGPAPSEAPTSIPHDHSAPGALVRQRPGRRRSADRRFRSHGPHLGAVHCAHHLDMRDIVLVPREDAPGPPHSAGGRAGRWFRIDPGRSAGAQGHTTQ